VVRQLQRFEFCGVNALLAMHIDLKVRIPQMLNISQPIVLLPVDQQCQAVGAHRSGSRGFMNMVQSGRRASRGSADGGRRSGDGDAAEPSVSASGASAAGSLVGWFLLFPAEGVMSRTFMAFLQWPGAVLLHWQPNRVAAAARLAGCKASM